MKFINKNKLLYIIVTVLAGLLALMVFIQLNAYNHISNLTDINAHMTEDFTMEHDLFQVRKKVGVIEDKLDSLLNGYPQSKALIVEIEFNINKDLERVRQQEKAASALAILDSLDRICQRKIRLTNTCMEIYEQYGKDSALTMLAREKAIKITDELTFITHTYEALRHHELEKLSAAAESNIRNAKVLNLVILVIIVVGCLFLIYYIVRNIKKQQSLIKKLEDSHVREMESAAIKEKFIANISHDIRTPLNAIIGFTYLLQQRRLPAEIETEVSAIEQSSNLLLAIVNDLLDISKIDSGTFQLRKGVFNLHDTITSVMQMSQIAADKKDLVLVLKEKTALPQWLEGDRYRFSQVLINLIDNAIKYSDEGSVYFSLTATPGPEGQISITGEIRDEGRGISSADLPHIFDRFQQGNILREQHSGVGLGLAIVAELVRLMQGRIHVDSVVGQGTVFTFTVPFRQISLPGTTPKLHRAEPENILAGVKILIVEDNIVNQKLLQSIFAKWEITADVAATGEDALELYARNKDSYQLILCDLKLRSDISGYDIVRILKKEQGCRIPVIAMTGNDVGTMNKEHWDDYLQKPVQVSVLYKVLAKYIYWTGHDTRIIPQQQQDPGYELIQLDYMRSISNGDTTYEKEVTADFLKQGQYDLSQMQEAVASRNEELLNATIHNHLTTISIMGLGDKFEPLLQQIANTSLPWQERETLLGKFEELLAKAVKEAIKFKEGLE